MWFKIFIFFWFSSVLAELTAPGIDRTVSDGVRSISYNVIYGDEDMTVINQVVQDDEKWNSMTKNSDLILSIPPLPAEDVKCLMSVDRYCSKSMVQLKSVLIQALKDDCAKCDQKEKESAGKVVASMMAHDPVAWKIFLTRTALLNQPEREPLKDEKPRFTVIGDAEYIENTKNRYTMPGVKVRVKRFAMERIN